MVDIFITRKVGETTMGFREAKCTQCGAAIKVDESKEAGICEYCGTPFITEKVINNYNTTVNHNYDGAIVNIIGKDSNSKYKYACPRCGSDKTQSYELVYENGITETTSIDPKTGDKKVKVALETLAKSCVPPKEPKEMVYSSGSCLGCLVLIITILGGIYFGIIGVVIAIIISYIAYSKLYSEEKEEQAKAECEKKNKLLKQEYYKKYDEWTRSFFCMKCGNRYIVESEKDEVDIKIESVGIDKDNVRSVLEMELNIKHDEAIKIIEEVPCVFRKKVNVGEAKIIKKKLEKSGAIISLN